MKNFEVSFAGKSGLYRGIARLDAIVSFCNDIGYESIPHAAAVYNLTIVDFLRSCKVVQKYNRKPK